MAPLAGALAGALAGLKGPLRLLESSARPAGCPRAAEPGRGGSGEEEEEEGGAAPLGAPAAAPG